MHLSYIFETLERILIGQKFDSKSEFRICYVFIKISYAGIIFVSVYKRAYIEYIEGGEGGVFKNFSRNISYPREP